MMSAKKLMSNETAAGPQNSLNNDQRREHELMTLQNKTATAQTARKLTQAEKIHNKPAVDNTELQETT